MLMEQMAPIHLASLFLQNYNDKKKFDVDITETELSTYK